MSVLLLPNAEYGIIQAYEKLSRNVNCREHGRHLRDIGATMDTIPRTSGIYQILCIPTGKVYIGSAINLQQRWRGHRSSANRGTHKNRYLQNAWNKYGESAFTFTVIELILASFLLEREQYWLDKTRCYDQKIGFNLYKTAGSAYGMRASDIARQRMSVAMRGKPHGPMSDETRARLSASKLGKKYKPHTTETRQAKSIRQMGHVISEETRRRIGDRHRGKPVSDATRCAQLIAVSKTWVVIGPDGVEQVVIGLEAFCREHGLIANCMRLVAKGRQHQHKGWKCRYP